MAWPASREIRTTTLGSATFVVFLSHRRHLCDESCLDMKTASACISVYLICGGERPHSRFLADGSRCYQMLYQQMPRQTRAAGEHLGGPIRRRTWKGVEPLCAGGRPRTRPRSPARGCLAAAASVCGTAPLPLSLAAAAVLPRSIRAGTAWRGRYDVGHCSAALCHPGTRRHWRLPPAAKRTASAAFPPAGCFAAPPPFGHPQAHGCLLPAPPPCSVTATLPASPPHLWRPTSSRLPPPPPPPHTLLRHCHPPFPPPSVAGRSASASLPRLLPPPLAHRGVTPAARPSSLQGG